VSTFAPPDAPQTSCLVAKELVRQRPNERGETAGKHPLARAHALAYGGVHVARLLPEAGAQG